MLLYKRVLILTSKLLPKYYIKLKQWYNMERKESYTSKTSFFDNDEIPKYNLNSLKRISSGKRVKRGLYQTKKDISLIQMLMSINILKKSSVVCLIHY